MTLFSRLRARALDPLIRERTAFYDADVDRPTRERLQLDALNREWQRIRRDVPHYAQLTVPERFRSLEEFFECIRPTTREAVQRHAAAMTSRSRRPEWVRMTGGSTSRPVQMPAWRAEQRHMAGDMWTARGWFGVRPDSRLFMIWGHSHLLGSGMAGRLKALRRRASDFVLAYHRFSAYDLRPEAMRRAGASLLRFAPDYVIGYSVALHELVRANADRADAFQRLGLAAVIGTAEGFPSAEARQRVGDVLGGPVAMEYGTVECGVMAHEHPEGGYRAFWGSFLLEAERTHGDRHLLRVTSLHPRCFPLVRYEVGDEIELPDSRVDREWAIARFRRVIGRCNDYVEVDGTLVHSEAFSHALRPCQEVLGFQVVRTALGLRIRYTAEAELDETSREEIRERLHRIHPRLADAIVERVAHLPQTVAGKTRMVVDETADPWAADQDPS
jgi:phenylacetate-coenzyme A ligase PaaK-like adenylate-forming protein